MTLGPLFMFEKLREPKLCQPRILQVTTAYHYRDRNFGSRIHADERAHATTKLFISVSFDVSIRLQYKRSIFDSFETRFLHTATFLTLLSLFLFPPFFSPLFSVLGRSILEYLSACNFSCIAYILYRNLSSGTGFDESNPAKEILRELCGVLRRIMTTLRVPSVSL